MYVVRSSQRGFTLIEGIIATGIISTALIVGLALAVSNLTAAQTNADRVIAGNLAREGIEVIRNVRDSNWIRRAVNIDKDNAPSNGVNFYSWDTFRHMYTGIDIDVPHMYIFTDPLFSQFGSGLSYSTNYGLYAAGSNYDPYGLLPCMAANDMSCRIQKDKATGLYYQFYSHDPNTADLTPFYRIITMKAICWDGATETVSEIDPNVGTASCATGTKIGLLVTSHVGWRRSEKLLEVQIKERMYDWRSN